MNTIKLNNGVEMPQIGYGVYQVSPNEYERCISLSLIHICCRRTPQVEYLTLSLGRLPYIANSEY